MLNKKLILVAIFSIPLLLMWNNEAEAENEELFFVTVDQQVQIVSDVRNSQDKTQPFAYLVQIQDDQGITISFGWITGSLSPKQMLSPGLSWTPEKTGSYTASIFVWESLENPQALSPSLSIEIEVRE